MSRMENRSVIVTADDFGLSPEINRAIVEAHEQGVVTAASLLVNAPSTQEAISLARQTPTLEIGIHLSIVEGISLLAEQRGEVGSALSIVDALDYFAGRPCLIRGWKQFIPLYALRRIDLDQLRDELELQILCFLEHFEVIPFANSTQHLHVLPGIAEVVLGLAKKYRITRFRTPSPMPDLPGFGEQRWLSARVLQLLGNRFRGMAESNGIKMPEMFWGFPHSGRMTTKTVVNILDKLPAGVHEIMLHPGYETPALRKNLPWGYANFDWEGELTAAKSREVLALYASRQLERATFATLG